MTFLSGNKDDPALFDFDALKDRGLDLATDYAAADPFPHIVIDDFLPSAVIDLCLSQFPQQPDADSQTFDRNQERLKTSFHPDHMAPKLRRLFYAFNSRPFIKVIENISGIKGLIPDPYFLGGGFHEIANGGHLSMHADFNHHKPLGLERRINVLIYLNRDWKDEYGGQLELWRTDMSERVHAITPIANRCVIFTTTGDSMHGNPQPVAHPESVTRKSIALYYYTATWEASKASRTTQFRPRPGTGDETDWKVKIDEALEDFLPPILNRQVARLRRRLSRR
ncbi:2OG-Fe(II) oxygenase [Hyphococcus flavus]|uniref:2OG-Fe(II) oxygenase n=1 Tax=Hyphococcus flavus TaxID=1866326 RepID=A0AAE9ZIJ0_9PROT|nr:2OG-Fe(II) oxygenase [Hyphococcus flavus]WDI30960.1 2OG-Fe(II) oxygenase [Hyphococcus flavus]